MKIYVASSWRNQRQVLVVSFLRSVGHDVYDFRHPADGDTGFCWASIDVNWNLWDARQFTEALAHPLAEKGFQRDREALFACDMVIVVLPCGRSAHIEAGVAVGMGKKSAVVLTGNDEPELMYGFFDYLFPSFAAMCKYFNELNSCT